MKATILHETLNKALATVVRIIPSRGQLPVLGNVLIEAKKDEIWLSATNLEIGIRTVLGGKVLEEGAITIPAKNLAEYVTSMNGNSVEMETSGEKLTVASGKLSATFTGIAASEFPVMPQSRAGERESRRAGVKTKIIEEIAREVAYAAATDESRPVLTGVQFKSEKDELIVTATDGFRLSRKKINIDGDIPGMDGGLILPGRTIMELARICTEGKKEEVAMEMVSENNQVIFEYGQIQLISRILEGNFPDVEKIVPADFKTEIIADREELLRAVRAGAIFARDNNNIMKFNIGDKGIRIQAVAQQTGESEVEVEAEKKGEDGVIAFNFRYVLDFSGSLSGERVTFKMNDSLSPGVWGEEGNEGLVHIIMPVRV